VRTLEVRRHAKRDPAADALSAAGRAQAEDVGRTFTEPFDVVFISPAQRAAETVAWFLRGAGGQLPAHAVIPGLAAQDNDASPLAMAGVIYKLYPAAATTKLATAHFWLHNVGLPIFMAGLAAMLSTGDQGLIPIVAGHERGG